MLRGFMWATVAELVRWQTYDLRVMGSSPGWVCYSGWPWASQMNIIPLPLHTKEVNNGTSEGRMVNVE